MILYIIVIGLACFSLGFYIRGSIEKNRMCWNCGSKSKHKEIKPRGY